MQLRNDTQWLSKFKIEVTSNSNRLYRNGNQQVKVTVSLTPAKGQEITDGQLDSIWLFLISDDGQYRDLRTHFGERAYQAYWPSEIPGPVEPQELFRVSTVKDPRFEYYAASGSAPLNLIESSSRARTFYISSLAPAGERYKIYAAITKEEGVEYATSTSIFNAHAEIETVASPHKKRSDFTLERVHEYEGKSGDTDVDIDLYYLEFANRHFKIVDAIPYGPNADDSYYSDALDVSPWYRVFDGVWPARIYEEHFHYALKPGEPGHFTSHDASVAVNTREGAMNFIRLELIGYGSDFTKYTRTFFGPSRWGVLDQYGNEYGIQMTQENGGNELNFKMRH
ncbi:hypothetical protein ABDX87_08335 [Pseudomonas abietaniphila]|uniref:hypothetical protein n=1 Tax=Pseudomonas abietaniphila TaxID=89065 RepID=UPI00321692B6